MKTTSKWIPIIGLFTTENDQVFKDSDIDYRIAYFTYHICAAIFVMMFIAVNIILAY